jgi:RNA polymerase sigma-70 factor (ECF subfamily)
MEADPRPQPTVLTDSLALQPDEMTDELASPVAMEPAERRFAKLYRDHADRVYALCLRMSGDRERATDLAQEAFVRVWRGIDRAPEDPGAWVWRIARNTVLNALRGDRRLRARLEFVSDLGPLETPATPRTPLPVRQMDLAAGIARLPPKARAVFVLHDVEGYSHDEIATLMDVAPGTVRGQLHRARTLLRETLHEHAP